MPVPIDLELRVHYGFAYLRPLEDDAVFSYRDAAAGQANGLLGARCPGALTMKFGLHTGVVPFTLAYAETAPDVSDEWEDVVEASFEVDHAEYAISTFDGHEDIDLPAPASYRARFCASGMDAAHAQDTRSPGEPTIDRYLLTLWPAPAEPDRVVRVGSKQADYWHRNAANSEVARRPTRSRRTTRVVLNSEEQRAAHAKQERRLDQMMWGGDPSDGLRAIGRSATAIARADIGLAEQLAALDPARRREIAVWAARTICERVTSTRLDWASALEALDSGTRLPPPFDDRATAMSVASPGSPTIVAQVRTTSAPQPPSAGKVGAVTALVAILAADKGDVFETLNQAVAGLANRTPFFTELRERFSLTWLDRHARRRLHRA